MIREVFSSLRHNKARTILILILNTLTFYLALTALTNSFAFYTQISDVRKLFCDDPDNTYRIDAVNIENEDNIGVDFEELKAFINAKENAVCGAYDIVGTYFDELTDNSAYENRSAAVDVIFIDTEILQILNLELTESDFHLSEKDGEQYFPLYAGTDFNKTLSIGDTLTMSNSGEKYIVSGFLDNKKWLDGSDPITMPPVSLDHMFLAQFSEREKRLSVNDFNMIHHSTVGKIFINCSHDIADEFTAKAAEKGIKFKVTSISDFIELWRSNNEKSIKQLFFLSAVVLICSAISIVSVLCVNILLKKKEYGIRIAFGSTKERMILSLCIEMLFLNVISGIAAFGLSYRGFAGSIIQSYREIYLRTLRSTSLLCLIGLTVLLMILVLIVPVKLIKRYDPASLIREEE